LKPIIILLIQCGYGNQVQEFQISDNLGKREETEY